MAHHALSSCFVPGVLYRLPPAAFDWALDLCPVQALTSALICAFAVLSGTHNATMLFRCTSSAIRTTRRKTLQAGLRLAQGPCSTDSLAAFVKRPTLATVDEPVLADAVAVQARDLWHLPDKEQPARPGSLPEQCRLQVAPGPHLHWQRPGGRAKGRNRGNLYFSLTTRAAGSPPAPARPAAGDSSPAAG